MSYERTRMQRVGWKHRRWMAGLGLSLVQALLLSACDSDGQSKTRPVATPTPKQEIRSSLHPTPEAPFGLTPTPEAPFGLTPTPETPFGLTPVPQASPSPH